MCWQVDRSLVGDKPSLLLSLLGLVGLTSFAGVRVRGGRIAGRDQTFVVTGAAGACGSIAGQVIITPSTSGAVPYKYKLFQYSLDRYGTACIHTCSGTVPPHLSTLQTKRTKLYQYSLYRDETHKILGLRSEQNGTGYAMWTGRAVPF